MFHKVVVEKREAFRDQYTVSLSFVVFRFLYIIFKDHWTNLDQIFEVVHE